MRIFACVHHAPDQVATWLADILKLSPTDFNYVTTGVNKKQVQFFLEYGLFVKYHKDLQLKSDRIAVVFGSPLQFHSWNLTPLDYFESDEPHLNAFEYKELDKSILRSHDVVPKQEQQTYLDKIIGLVSQFDSLLHGFMSFIYTMKSNERDIAKMAACRYLHNGHSVEVLRKELSSLNDRYVEKLMQLLSSDVAKRIRSAFADKISIEERAKKYSVSAYELRYIESNATKKIG